MGMDAKVRGIAEEVLQEIGRHEKSIARRKRWVGFLAVVSIAALFLAVPFWVGATLGLAWRGFRWVQGW